MRTVVFPIKAFADICASRSGASVHENKDGTFSLNLTIEQYDAWVKAKRKAGVC